jgi:hypothetical protein
MKHRRCHRKCDRVKPACTYCHDRNKKCTYAEPLQKISKTSSVKRALVVADTTKKYIAYPSAREDELARQSTVLNHINVCLDDMYYFFPVMDVDRVRCIVAYIRDVMNTGLATSSTDFQPEQGELALVFATQGAFFCELI